MYTFSVENKGTNTFLSCELNKEDVIDGLGMGMVTNNEIPGVLPFNFVQLDSDRYLKYNISSKVSLKQLFASPVNKTKLTAIFIGMIDGIFSLEDYMLDYSMLLFQMDHIYVNVSTLEIGMVLLPIEGISRNVELNAFFKEVMFGVSFDQTENCEYVTKIINYLNGEFDIRSFKELLQEVSGNVPPQMGKGVQRNVMDRNMGSVVVKDTVMPQIESGNPESGPNPKPISSKNPVSSTSPPQNVIPPMVGKAPPEGKGAKKKGLFHLFSKQGKTNNKDVKNPVPTNIPVSEIPGKPNRASKKENNRVVKGQPIPGMSGTGNQGTNPQPSEPRNNPVMNMGYSVKPQLSEETSVLSISGSEDTTVLGADSINLVKANPRLVRMKNNEIITLNKVVFRLGKERDYVDCYIGDNTAISRAHAEIIMDNGNYYIVDNNSLNHTYVDGVQIQSQKKVALSDGMKIRLANEEFEFRL